MCKKIPYSWLQNILYITSFGIIFSFLPLRVSSYIEIILPLLLCTVFISWIFILIKLFQDKVSLKNYFTEIFSLKNPRGSLHITGNILSIIWILCSPIIFLPYIAPEFMSGLGGVGVMKNIVGNILGGLVPLGFITLYLGGWFFLIVHILFSIIQYKKGYISGMKNYIWIIFFFGICILWIILAYLYPFSL